MKKIIKIIVIIFISMLLVSCEDKVIDDGDIEYRFLNLSNEYNVEDKIVDLHFEENSILPYISIEEFIKMLDGVYYADEFEFIKNFQNNSLTINLEIEYEEKTYFESLIVKADENTIEVTSLDFFSLYLESTETDYGEGLINLDPIIIEGSSVLYNLAEYDFEILIIDDNFYMSLFLMNLIFNQGNYFDLIFNGEIIYGFDTNKLENKDLKKILKSKYNDLEAPTEVKIASYNFYRFVIDYFYGLKDERNIEDSGTFIDETNFLEGSLNRSIFENANKFDDLHTSHNSIGLYENNLSKFNFNGNDIEKGPHIEMFYQNIADIQEEAVKYFGVKSGYINIPDYEIINNDTAVIYLTGFDVDTPKEVENILEELDSNVIENVVIDLTFNTGGNLGAVLRILTLITNEEIWYHLANKVDSSSASYGVVGEKDAYDNFNYVIKSSGITFSAANLMVSIAKDLGIKVIGKKSSGGASPINFIVFPDGSIINMSSTNYLSDKNYNSIELGIVPDIELVELYDKNEIAKVFNRS